MLPFLRYSRMKNYYVDLHMHTRYSDGTTIPEQNVIDAAILGMEVISITDHDITTGYKEAVQEAKRWGVKVLPGVEVSTARCHILGYCFDIENKQFQDFLAYSRNCQEEIVKERVERLQDIGIPITFEKLKNYFPETRLGKVNLSVSLILDEECREYLGNPAVQDIFKTYLRKGGLASGIEAEEATPQQAIDEIHGAGGIAVLAHPCKDFDSIEELDIMKGLDGMETQPKYFENNKAFEFYARQHGLLITYGSDFHGARYISRPMLDRTINKMLPFW